MENLIDRVISSLNLCIEVLRTDDEGLTEEAIMDIESLIEELNFSKVVKE